MRQIKKTTPNLDERFWLSQALAENMRIESGKPKDLAAHLERLAEGCKALGWPAPDLRSMRRICLAEAKGSKLKLGSLRLRYWSGWNGEEEVFLAQALPLKPLPAAWKKGIKLMTSAVRHYGAASLQGRLKANAMLPNWMSKAEVEAWADDGLRLTPEGCVAEGVWSNIVVIKGGVLRTPPLALGVLEGVTRAKVLATYVKKINIQEEPLTRYDLWTADEVWICSSIRGTIPVGEIDGRPIGARYSNAI